MTGISMQTTFGTVEVHPGVLDENAKRALMTGHCIRLAAEVALATDWGVVVDLGAEFFDGGDDLRQAVRDGDDMPAGIIHAWVRTSDGLLLDAIGTRTYEEYETRVNDEFDEDCFFYDLDVTTALLMADKYCPPCDQEWIESMVAPVLAKSGYGPDGQARSSPTVLL